MQLINPNIDLSPYQSQLKEHSRIVINNFLVSDIAEQLRDCLLNNTPWDLAYFDDGHGVKLTNSERYNIGDHDLNRKIEQIKNCSPNEYQFLYDSYMIVTAYLEGRNKGHLLHQFLEAINDQPFLLAMKNLTQETGLLKIDAQATRYAKGHFLKEHIDADSIEGRRFAYVLSLTKNWLPDWGGLLHFNNNNQVIETITPQFNTLSVFEVPQEHFVSSVTGYAGEQRISITGWMYNK